MSSKDWKTFTPAKDQLDTRHPSYLEIKKIMACKEISRPVLFTKGSMN